MYKSADSYQYRPNTKKLYEDYYNTVVPDEHEVHHILPVRLGGTHDITNLTVLHQKDHALAHLMLFEQFGDPRDLCAYHMISGRSREVRLTACATGGRASQVAKKERGEANGFQLFSEEKRKAIAIKAGAIGGTKQKELGLGIHADEETRRKWARMGGLSSVEANGFTDPARQAERGRKGGVKNKGSRWYHNGVVQFKYTAEQQTIESFNDFIARTGFNKGRLK